MQEIDLQTAIENYTGEQFEHNAIRCPFHSDKRPSLTVKYNRFRCWSCGASGSVIDFAQRYFGDSFRDAVQRLADDFNLDLPTDQRQQQTARPDLWADVELETMVARVAELTERIEELTAESNRLIDEHQERWRAGEHEAADQIAERIDEIDNEKEYYIKLLRGVNYGNGIL